MRRFDPEFGVTVIGNEIIVTLRGTTYSVTYFIAVPRIGWRI
jgi:hypothetical protein